MLQHLFLLSLSILIQTDAFTQPKKEVPHTRLKLCSSAEDPTNNSIPQYKSDLQKRRQFLTKALLTTSFLGTNTQAPFLLPFSNTANAFDFPFFSSSTLLRTKATAPFSTLSSQTNFLMSPGSGTDTQSITYPAFFEGKWNITSTYIGKVYPLGERFVPRRIRKRGSIRRDEDVPGDSVSYLQDYRNSNGVTLPNREFNTEQQVNAQRGYEEVSEVKYDAKKQRITILLNTLGVDMQPLPPGRNEIFITNHAQEYSLSMEGINEEKKVKEKDLLAKDTYNFSTMEFYRIISLGVRTGTVLETATYFTYNIDPDQNIIVGKQRICLFLPPLPSGEEGDLYFEASNRAVAVYDYDVLLTRI